MTLLPLTLLCFTSIYSINPGDSIELNKQDIEQIFQQNQLDDFKVSSSSELVFEFNMGCSDPYFIENADYDIYTFVSFDFNDVHYSLIHYNDSFDYDYSQSLFLDRHYIRLTDLGFSVGESISGRLMFSDETFNDLSIGLADFDIEQVSNNTYLNLSINVYLKNIQYDSSAYSSGYEMGYSVGYGDASALYQNQVNTLSGLFNFFDLIGSAFTSIGGFLSIEIIPNISIGLLCAIPLGVGIILFVIKLIS